MGRQVENLLAHWMHQLKIPLSSQYVKGKLLAHSDYPSLLSITDTLDELGIDNAALVVDKKKLNEIPVPFLAHTAVKGGEFILVTSLKTLFKEHPDFNKQWNGVIVAAEKTKQWNNEENKKQLAREKRKRRLVWLSAASIILLSALSLWNQSIWQYFGLLITSLFGLGVAILIAQHELGISNELTEQLCAAGKNTDCDAVMNSKSLKFLNWFNWADAGIIYFSSVFLLLVISFFTGTTQSFEVLLALLAICSLPFTIFSLYYQWRIVKKWCPLCLATVGLLWIQFALFLPVILSLTKDGFDLLSINTILITVFLLALTSTVWLQLIKPSLQKNTELTDKNFSLLRFKNNPEVFKVLLQQQRRVDITPFKNDLQLGNPNADIQIIVACSPYCGPCAKTHKILHELVEKNDIGLTIRFAVKTENNDDKKLQAVKYILQLLKGKKASFKRKALYDWYSLMNFEKFTMKYPMPVSVDVDEQLKEQEKWTKESKVSFTPTVFINGFEMSKQYRVEDLKNLVRRLLPWGTVNKELIIETDYSLV